LAPARFDAGAGTKLFIEDNHRTGALIKSYLLAREGRAYAREHFNPSSVFKKTNKRSVVMRRKMPGATTRLPANSSWV
jgi:hypothetical protein